MPFDATPPEVVTYPELRQLRDLLRDKSKWPKGFKWQFEECHTCAMGLLLKINGLRQPKTFEYSIHLTGNLLKIPTDEVERLFGMGLSRMLRIPGRAVTPEMVADGIDTWLTLTT